MELVYMFVTNRGEHEVLFLEQAEFEQKDSKLFKAKAEEGGERAGQWSSAVH